jgi:hypothetical protein
MTSAPPSTTGPTVISETGVFGGEFVVSGLTVFAGLIGGGVSEQSVAGCPPAGSDVGEGADDQGRFVVGVVGGADGPVFGSGVLAAPVGDAGLAEVAEAEGVVAGFGEEVAAEAGHVGPSPQAAVVGAIAEGPAGVDEPIGVGAQLRWRKGTATDW